MQVDNQLPNAVTQVIVHPTQQRAPQPTLRMFARKNLVASQAYQLASYDMFQFVFQEIDVNLEQQTVLAMWEFLQDSMVACPTIFGSGKDDPSPAVSGANSHSSMTSPPAPRLSVANDIMSSSAESGTSLKSRNSADNITAGVTGADLYSIEREIVGEENKLYISHFQLHPIKINVSFVMTQDHSIANKTTTNPKSLVEIKSKNAFLTSFTSFMKQIGELLLDLSSNITRAPIYIHSTNYDHLLTSEPEISRILKNFYFHSIVTQVSILN
jgi:hypothetical protein